MTLQQFFRLAMISRFQNMLNPMLSPNDYYQAKPFILPRIRCKDGFSVSYQIGSTHYCESNNGYRVLGDTWKMVEFGFPSYKEELLEPHKEEEDEPLTNSVGMIPIEIAQQVIDKHGGIDFDKTLSVDAFKDYVLSVEDFKD